jgi:hypothetical protein
MGVRQRMETDIAQHLAPSFAFHYPLQASVSVFGIIQYNNYMGNNDKNITVTQESYGHPSLLVQESAMR